MVRPADRLDFSVHEVPVKRLSVVVVHGCRIPQLRLIALQAVKDSHHAGRCEVSHVVAAKHDKSLRIVHRRSVHIVGQGDWRGRGSVSSERNSEGHVHVGVVSVRGIICVVGVRITAVTGGRI